MSVGASAQQNRHRSQDGWQAGTVAAILQNPRYTGYAVFGRWTKHEELLDPDDAAAGNIARFRRSPTHRVVRSKRPAHPAIVSVETFTQAQLLRGQRAGTSNRSRGKLERNRPASGLRPYLLSGLVRCDACGRKMQAELVRDAVYYRCRAKSIAPGSPLLQEHPRTVNLREDIVLGPDRCLDRESVRPKPPREHHRRPHCHPAHRRHRHPSPNTATTRHRRRSQTHPPSRRDRSRRRPASPRHGHEHRTSRQSGS
ncbi:recombinase family protein [Nocardia sp. NPDC049737]|uniref:recombinase family protein n=1 Tax=Nocardia sp. NPDC049737 TaxID=3154358 RepID=UPI0034489B93